MPTELKNGKHIQYGTNKQQQQKQKQNHKTKLMVVRAEGRWGMNEIAEGD